MTKDARDLQDFKAALLQTDDTLRQLVAEHHHLDERVHHLSTFAHLTDEQRYEEASLKKRKLVLKDRIESIVRSHRGGLAEAMPQH
jgi:uncharacterized protein YdcH (DUF465 family)